MSILIKFGFYFIFFCLILPPLPPPPKKRNYNFGRIYNFGVRGDLKSFWALGPRQPELDSEWEKDPRFWPRINKLAPIQVRRNGWKNRLEKEHTKKKEITSILLIYMSIRKEKLKKVLSLPLYQGHIKVKWNNKKKSRINISKYICLFIKLIKRRV